VYRIFQEWSTNREVMRSNNLFEYREANEAGYSRTIENGGPSTAIRLAVLNSGGMENILENR
jgi:hypothetical protein